jgi:hypothetical protein
MKNSYAMPQPIEHSGPKKLLKHNGTRTASGPTPANHFKVIPHSGADNMNIGNPYAVASDRTEQAIGTKMTVTPHSPVPVPRNPKKFNKQQFAMGVPTKLTR